MDWIIFSFVKAIPPRQKDDLTMNQSEIEAISTVTRELSTMLTVEADHLDSGIHRHIWNQIQALNKLTEPAQTQQKAADLAGTNGQLRIAKPDTIEIHQTERGYSVEFPYKPSANAIRGFHSLSMAWRSAGLDGRVIWSIPAGKLDQAVEFIEYWYSVKGGSRINYSVEVITLAA